MDRMMSREQRRARDADLLARSKVTRLLWASQSEGTAIRTPKGYRHKPVVAKVKHKPTESEDNAAGRKIRRRTNKALLGWRPYGKR